MIGWAVPVALAAVGCFAVSTSLQHRAASTTPAESGIGGLLSHLARQPAWVVGVLAGGAGFALHALALRLGPLTLVQPLLVGGVVLALPVRAGLEHARPSGRAVGWAAVAAAGLALFLVAAAPQNGRPTGDGRVAVLLVASGTGVALAATAIGVHGRTGRTRRTERTRGLLLGLAAGVLFGLTGGALKLTVIAVGHGFAAVLGTWPLYAVVLLGVWGVAANQLAYRAAPLPVSMPLLNMVNPLVAIVFGAYVFGEHPRDQPVAVVLEILGLGMMGGGVAMLARASGDGDGDGDRGPGRIPVRPRTRVAP